MPISAEVWTDFGVWGLDGLWGLDDLGYQSVHQRHSSSKGSLIFWFLMAAKYE